MDYDKLSLRPNADNKFFWDACKEHQLRFQRCSNCTYIRWPASVICPVCYSNESDLITARGKGKIYTFVVYHQAYLDAVASDVPYVVGVVQLDEGPRILTNIVGCRPDEVECDMPVEVTWKDVHKDLSIPHFKPVVMLQK